MREYLKSMREERHLSQQDIANTLGHYQSYYSSIENGEKQQDMRYSTMVKLAAAFDVSVQTIIDAEAEYQSKREDSA